VYSGSIAESRTRRMLVCRYTTLVHWKLWRGIGTRYWQSHDCGRGSYNKARRGHVRNGRRCTSSKVFGIERKRNVVWVPDQQCLSSRSALKMRLVRANLMCFSCDCYCSFRIEIGRGNGSLRYGLSGSIQLLRTCDCEESSQLAPPDFVRKNGPVVVDAIVIAASIDYPFSFAALLNSQAD
jgi:hypothetical protein